MLVTEREEVVAEYPTAKGWRVFIYLFGPPLVLLFLYGAWMIWQNNQQEHDSIIIWLLIALLTALAVFMGYCIAILGKIRFIITSDRLIERNAWPFRSKEIALTEVAGFRTNNQFTLVVAKKPNTTKLKISYTAARYDELQLWLADHYPNLDVVEQEAEEAAILEDYEIGRNPEERADKLAAAKKTAMVLNIAGGTVAAWLFLHPTPYTWAIAAGLLLPLLSTLALWQHSGVLWINEKNSSAYPSVALALLLPSAILILRAMLDFDLVSFAPLWPVAGAVALVFALLLAAGNREFLARPNMFGSTAFAVVFYAALYGFGATTAYNSAFDSTRPAVYEAKVLNKHVSSGKTTTYYLTVSAWGPFQETNDVTVSGDYYDHVATGTNVTIYLMPGRLGIPWFTVGE